MLYIVPRGAKMLNLSLGEAKLHASVARSSVKRFSRLQQLGDILWTHLMYEVLIHH